MIDTLYQRGTDQALDDLVRRPLPEPPGESKFSLAGLVAAPFRGVGGGVAESIAGAAEVTGAFGQVLGATGVDSAGGMFALPTAAERKQAEAARRKMLDQGVDYSNEAGDLFRQRAAEIMPDPQTAHASAQLVAGVAKFATKAVTAAATSGPAAPLTLAADEGLSEADRLKQQGVDLATRTKAGAVAGSVAGASIVVPVVGRTVLQTAGLVGVAGPGGFMAQNAVTRAILEHAGYDKIGEHYDPFDPVGLTVSTLVPAAFGAMGYHYSKPAPLVGVVKTIESGGRRYGPDGQLLTSPKGALGEMQVMPATARDPGFGIKPAKDNSPEELARVGREYLDAMQQRYGGDTDKVLAAYNAGPGAVDAALAKGGDWLARLPKETRDYVAKGRELTAMRGAAADPDLVAAARVHQTADIIDALRLTRDGDIAGMESHLDALQRAHDQLAAGEPVNVADVVKGEADPARLGASAEQLGAGHEPLVDRVADVPPIGEQHPLEAALTRLRQTIEVTGRHELDISGEIAQARTLLAKGSAEQVINGAAERGQPLTPTLNNVLIGAGEAAGNPMKLAGMVDHYVAQVREAKPGAEPHNLVATAVDKARTGEAPKAEKQTPLDAQAAEVHRLNPDMLVHLEGMDKPARIGDVLRNIMQEAAGDLRDSSLVQVAANCLLRNG